MPCTPKSPGENTSEGARRLAEPVDRAHRVLPGPGGQPRMTEQAERTARTALLQAQRRSVLAIIDGLDEKGVREVAVPSGWTPLGMIEHLAHAGRFWFQQVRTGRAAALPWAAPGTGAMAIKERDRP